ncbi:MAG: flavodoxin-dependent (E)-4-hydroxy-3-methylbut-2-enyl-diphosphate synthase [Clostridiales bacterium]|nr:flavodoxin-dependent (E)-4-hydroxy-3-methylbut-2-enyl-diphosphate synthase [Clostridiales bacterium]
MKKVVYVKNVAIGSGKIKLQSMTNTQTSDVKATLSQILALKKAGADMVRVSIPDLDSAMAIKELIKCGVPIIGDIHYSHKAALVAIENGIDKIRINPGNMSPESIKQVVLACKERNIPIRVGINKGSVKGKPTPKELAMLALDNAKLIEDIGYDNLVLAVKSSNVEETVRSYRCLANMCNYPLHIGLTEAGTANTGIIKSAIAIGSLILGGIGDTVRVSLAGDPVREIYAAKKILRACGIDKNYVEVIACPTCARTSIEVEEIASRLEELTKDIEKPIKIAVMGCVVNGIGESKDASFGIAGGKTKSALFVKGKLVEEIENEKIFDKLMELVKNCDD